MAVTAGLLAPYFTTDRAFSPPRASAAARKIPNAPLTGSQMRRRALYLKRGVRVRYGSFRKSTKSFEAPPPYFERDERLPVRMVSAISLDGRRIAVQITDLSERGVGGRSAEPLPIGAELLLALPGFGPVPIEIRWALDARFGARFLKRIDIQALCETVVTLVAE